MSAPTLYPFQDDVIKEIAGERAKGTRRILVTMPTGSGKTVVGAQLIDEAVASGEPALFVVHRRELTIQTAQKLDARGIVYGIVQAGFAPNELAKIQIVAIQTIAARAIRSTRMELPPARVIIVDEAHHATARTWRKLLDCYPQATIIGLTATPCRGDGRGLGGLFDVLIAGPSIAELTRLGRLAPAIHYAPTEPDLDAVPIQRGDYVEAALSKVMDQPQLVGDVCEWWHKLANGRKTVIFACGVAHSVHVRDQFRLSGVTAEHIDGSTPTTERDRILKGLRLGAVDVVVNASVLTEGWDAPEVSCLVLARPTRSFGLYLQMAGRVLRPSPGKTDALIIDHAGAAFEHGLVDDPIEWSLSEDKRADGKPSKRSRQKGEPRRLDDCPECHAVKLSGSPCGSCGWRPQLRGNAVDFIDGNLGLVGRDRTTKASRADREQFFAMLLGHCRDRGFKPGWAAHKYKEKFGTWPANGMKPAPLPPDAAVSSWIRSRQIAYAKARSAA